MSAPLDIRADFAALSKKAYLEVLVPKDDAFDAASILRDGSPEELQRAATRKQLYFDERSSLQVVLKTALPQSTLETLLPYLELTLAAHATTADPAASSNAAVSSTKHDVASVKHNAAGSDVEVLTVGESTYVVWKKTLHLAQPGSKVRRPAVYFTANLSPLADALAESSNAEPDYLPSFQPLPANVLEPLRFDASYGEAGREMYLSEMRVTKVAPTAPRLEPLMRPLRGATKRAFPIAPVLYTRFGYSSLTQSGVISLHIDAAKLVDGEVKIHDVALTVPGRDVRLLSSVTWPQQMTTGDEVVLLFAMSLPSKDIKEDDETHPILKLDATMSTDDGTSVQLSIHRPADVKIPPIAAPTVYHWTGAKATPDLEASSSSAHSRPTSGDQATKEVIFNFAGPAEVELGAEFVIHVQCVNRSGAVRSFNLRPANTNMTVRNKAKYPARGSSKAGIDTTTISTSAIAAPASQDPYVLVVTPDVRTESLAPGACCEVEVQYRAVRAGSLQLGVVHIEDLQSKQSVTVSDLPDIVAVR